MIKKYLYTTVVAVLYTVSVQADLYQANAIHVQGDGENTVQAKQVAMYQGHRLALQKVFRRLLGKDKEFMVDELDDGTIETQVQDISIQDEKNTTQTYWATLSVRFQPKLVQTFLNQHHQVYLQNEPPSYLVIPVINQSDGFIGLEDDNEFYQKLRLMEEMSDFYQMKVPMGDLPEMVAVNQALKSGQYQSLLDLAQNYGLNQVLIVYATPKSADNWRLMTQVVSNQGLVTQDVQVDDWYEALSLEQAWTKLLAQMEKNWREEDALSGLGDQVYYARLNEPSLAQWAQDEKKLKKLKFLKDLTLRGMYQDQLLLSFSYDGSRQELENDWATAGWEWQSDRHSSIGTLNRKEVYYE